MPRFLGLWLPDGYPVSPCLTSPQNKLHQASATSEFEASPSCPPWDRLKKQESTNEGPVPSNCAVHLTNLEPARPASRGNLPGGDILSSTGLMCRIQGFFLIFQFTKSVVAVLTNDKTSTDFKVIRPWLGCFIVDMSAVPETFYHLLRRIGLPTVNQTNPVFISPFLGQHHDACPLFCGYNIISCKL